MIAGGNNFTTGGSAREFKSQNTKGEIAMDFLSKLLQGISFVPALVTGIEKLLGGRSGEDKKDAALSFVQAALSHERRNHEPSNRRRAKIQRRSGQGN